MSQHNYQVTKSEYMTRIIYLTYFALSGIQTEGSNEPTASDFHVFQWGTGACKLTTQLKIASR